MRWLDMTATMGQPMNCPENRMQPDGRWHVPPGVADSI